MKYPVFALLSFFVGWYHVPSMAEPMDDRTRIIEILSSPTTHRDEFWWALTLGTSLAQEEIQSGQPGEFAGEYAYQVARIFRDDSVRRDVEAIPVLGRTNMLQHLGRILVKLAIVNRGEQKPRDHAVLKEVLLQESSEALPMQVALIAASFTRETKQWMHAPEMQWLSQKLPALDDANLATALTILSGDQLAADKDQIAEKAFLDGLRDARVRNAAVKHLPSLQKKFPGVLVRLIELWKTPELRQEGAEVLASPANRALLEERTELRSLLVDNLWTLSGPTLIEAIHALSKTIPATEEDTALRLVEQATSFRILHSIRLGWPALLGVSGNVGDRLRVIASASVLKSDLNTREVLKQWVIAAIGDEPALISFEMLFLLGYQPNALPRISSDPRWQVLLMFIYAVSGSSETFNQLVSWDPSSSARLLRDTILSPAPNSWADTVLDHIRKFNQPGTTDIIQGVQPGLSPLFLQTFPEFRNGVVLGLLQAPSQDIRRIARAYLSQQPKFREIVEVFTALLTAVEGKQGKAAEAALESLVIEIEDMLGGISLETPPPFLWRFFSSPVRGDLRLRSRFELSAWIWLLVEWIRQNPDKHEGLVHTAFFQQLLTMSPEDLGLGARAATLETARSEFILYWLNRNVVRSQNSALDSMLFETINNSTSMQLIARQAMNRSVGIWNAGMDSLIKACSWGGRSRDTLTRD